MSKMVKQFDACAGRDYKVSSGEEKTHWIHCGRMTQWDDDTFTFEQHAVPTFPGWNGKIKMFPQREV